MYVCLIRCQPEINPIEIQHEVDNVVSIDDIKKVAINYWKYQDENNNGRSETIEKEIEHIITDYYFASSNLVCKI